LRSQIHAFESALLERLSDQSTSKERASIDTLLPAANDDSLSQTLPIAEDHQATRGMAARNHSATSRFFLAKKKLS
jgi:hypothetical protein